MASHIIAELLQNQVQITPEHLEAYSDATMDSVK